MGPTFYSLAVRTPDPTAVREQIVNWMTAKGFELSTTRRMSRIDPDRERGFYLFSKGDWTTVLFSDIDEYDRLAFDLRKLNRPSLFLGCQDGKHWGYQLHNGEQLVDEFQTTTSYLNRPPNVRESAWKICLTLGIKDRFYEVCRLMRQRSVRSEYALQKFCSTLAITPASVPFDLIDESLFGLSEGSQLDDHRTEQLYFRLPRRFNRENSLHDRHLKEDRISGLSPPELSSYLENHPQDIAIQKFILFMISTLRIISRIFELPVITFPEWCSRIHSYLSWKFFGQSRVGVHSRTLLGTDSLGRFLDAVNDVASNNQRVNDRRVVNDYFGCSVLLPSNGMISANLMPYEIFSILIRNASLHASIIIEKELIRILRTYGSTLVCDESFTTSSGFEGRIVILEYGSREHSMYTSSYSIIRVGDFYFRFILTARDESVADRKELLKSIAMSFECHPQAQGSSAALPSDELPPSPETQA